MMVGGDIDYLTPGEIRQVSDASIRYAVGRDRVWEYLRQRAGRMDIRSGVPRDGAVRFTPRRAPGR